MILQIDFSRPLEEQGPFKVFIHKLTEVVALADRGDLNVSFSLKSVKVVFIEKFKLFKY